MQTIKSGVVVVLLLAVSYGAFVALNSPDPELPDSIREWASGEEELEKLIGMDIQGPETEAIQPTETISADQLLQGLQSNASESLGTLPSNSANRTLPELNVPELGMTSNPGSLATPEIPSMALPNLPQANQGSGSIPIPQLDNTPNISSFPALDSSAMTNGGVTTQEESPNSLIPKNLDALNSMSPSGNNSPPASLVSGTKSVVHSRSPMGSVGTSSPNDSPAIPAPTEKFAIARTKALALAQQQGKLQEALVILTPYFHSPELSTAESEDLSNLLDALSREVIYSKRHFLSAAHVCTPSDNVAAVAAKYKISPELLNRINGLGDAKALVPGSQLKVLQGPFHARISISKQELTLYLNNMYAGRFPISLGSDPQPKAGVFEVVDRQQNRTYYGAGAVVIPGDDPLNPYGGYWINLGDEQCIHGAAEMESSELAGAGCISLAPLDARDVFSILSLGSQVVITP